ncbi:major facilitator superfamily transporter [Fusarium tjaetaba]|uniref:Major facilitator superfamily transporter n=1 Tax=Fusarium tjaetaba TaxID=1567544 RepID=A0A8H5R350_9HYPO|nr:major facilitator superfamily transporter [Fusarium tjaetaba]KAF5627206.1 major facilitator superfamily transporter [Fusarium tjaetaba]
MNNDTNDGDTSTDRITAWEDTRQIPSQVANNDKLQMSNVDSSSSTQIPDQTSTDQSDAESIGGQRNSDLPRKRLLISITALSVCLFVSFLDQTSVSTATPSVAGELKTGTSTSWIGTSFLIASTAFQLINGRLSDIFGRKNMLLLCLFLMGVGDLACGFAKTPVQLIEGTIKELGMLGAIIALANGVGPFLGGAIVQSATWRWVFWMIPIITLPTTAIIWFYLPLKHRSGEYMAKIKKIDYGGIVLNIASTLLLLIPISGGGVTYAWTSAFFIATVIISIFLAILFVLFEWKLARLPIMPLRLYRAPHCWALYLQSFLTGLAYFGNFFYLPLYFQSVLGYDALVAGALILAVVIPTSLTSILSGQYMSRVGSYMHCILAGFALWTLGNGLTLIFDRETKLGPLIGILIVEGAGIGFTLQPTLVGMYANGRSEDRAVTTGLRNFIRTIGGAFGVVISGVILSNTLNKELGGRGIVSNDTIAQLTSSTYSLSSMGLSQQDQDIILDAYMKGLYYTFLFFTVCTGLSLVLTFWVGNTSLKSPAKSEDASGSTDREMTEDERPGQVDLEKAQR